MHDAELTRLFHVLEIGVEGAEPEPAFAEHLYGRLRAEARRSRPGQAVLLAVAAILVTGLVAGALVFGSGILPVPAPSESPSPSTGATASQGPTPSGLPTSVDGAKWVATAEPVNDWERIGEGFTVTLLLDGRVLMVGDVYVRNGASAPVTELFSPRAGAGTAGTWEATPSTIGQARDHHTATLLADGRVLVVGGLATADFPPMSTETILGSAEIYEPSTGLWTAAASMRVPRRDHSATLLADGRVLVAGGWVPDGEYFCDPLEPSRPCPVYVRASSAEVYDPFTGRWSTIEPMPYALADHTATRLADGRVLLLGDEPFVFDPDGETWTQTAPMGRPVGMFHTATLLDDGRVLVAGGNYPTSAGAQIYEPTTDRWSETGSMTEGRWGFTATRLLDGRVLAAGSGDGGYGGGESAELFDPDTGSWTTTTDMLRRRGFHEGTVLADGRVLVVAGFGNRLGQTSGVGVGERSPWAELYEPGGE